MKSTIRKLGSMMMLPVVPGRAHPGRIAGRCQTSYMTHHYTYGGAIMNILIMTLSSLCLFGSLAVLAETFFSKHYDVEQDDFWHGG